MRRCLPVSRLTRLATGVLLVAGLVGCGGGAPPQTFDLTAPRDGIAQARGRGLLVVAEPIALQVYDSDKIIIRTAQGGVATLPGVQWSDRLPKLFQARLIQTFENGRRIQAVGRPGDRLVPAAQLNTEIRAFGIEEATGEAVVEISAKIVNDRSGRILAGEIFVSRHAVGAINGPAASAALDLATQSIMRDIVRWVSGKM
jgi:cholesterol transport system auxiliary component